MERGDYGNAPAEKISKAAEDLGGWFEAVR
jgi:hypothetical protein